MCLWQEESLRGLYQQRLAEKISENPKVSTIDEEWENIKRRYKCSQRGNWKGQHIEERKA